MVSTFLLFDERYEFVLVGIRFNGNSTWWELGLVGTMHGGTHLRLVIFYRPLTIPNCNRLTPLWRLAFAVTIGQADARMISKTDRAHLLGTSPYCE